MIFFCGLRGMIADLTRFIALDLQLLSGNMD